MWTLLDLNSSKTLQMSCANLITLQSPFKYGYLDSNQGQLAPKASILPTELHPYIAESIVLETNAFYSTHYLAGKSTASVVYSPLISLSKNMRRNEVPTPKHFTAQSVFKTVPSPTELLLHWQDVRELNPNLWIDSPAH